MLTFESSAVLGVAAIVEKLGVRGENIIRASLGQSSLT